MGDGRRFLLHIQSQERERETAREERLAPASRPLDEQSVRRLPTDRQALQRRGGLAQPLRQAHGAASTKALSRASMAAATRAFGAAASITQNRGSPSARAR